ncbi:MAG: transcription antitermination factor NusB [Verrucomicrobiota bacterium JB025]|nr:transcription antitermination factor NusB [Verrucomicrobiota bacterium JB025]
MPSRRQIREAAVQFLYCADLEGGANPSELREPFWEFITESDRRRLQVATFRTAQHLAIGREDRLAEFVDRQRKTNPVFAAYPEAEKLKLALARIAKLESAWSTNFASLERLPKDDDDDTVAHRFGKALHDFFAIDRDLAGERAAFILALQDFPAIKGRLEAVTASIRRLQRISDRLRTVEEPEKFPEQGDLRKIRESKAEINELREQADKLINSTLAHKPEIDAKLAEVIENFAPERIDPVDRAILRLGSFELLHTNTPPKVVLNEAIELAKRYGTTDSRRFVNGILDQIATRAAKLEKSENPDS